MAVLEVRCPECHSLNVVKYGRQPNGKQRFLCQASECSRRIFLLTPVPDSTMVRLPTAMRQVIEKALAGGNIEETARELRLPAKTVAEVFQVLARFNPPPAGLSRPANGLKRRTATG